MTARPDKVRLEIRPAEALELLRIAGHEQVHSIDQIYATMAYLFYHELVIPTEEWLRKAPNLDMKLTMLGSSPLREYEQRALDSLGGFDPLSSAIINTDFTEELINGTYVKKKPGFIAGLQRFGGGNPVKLTGRSQSTIETLMQVKERVAIDQTAEIYGFAFPSLGFVEHMLSGERTDNLGLCVGNLQSHARRFSIAYSRQQY